MTTYLGAVAVQVLAKLAAKKAVKERLRQQGVKFYKHAELLTQASEYLAQHPELYEVALARAWEMGMVEQAERIDKTNYDDQRRKPGCDFNLKRRSSVA